LLGTTLLNLTRVQLERGYLSLSAIGMESALLLLSPLSVMATAIVGSIVGFLAYMRNGSPSVLNNLATTAAAASLTLCVRTGLEHLGSWSWLQVAGVVGTYTLMNWTLPALGLHSRTGESVISIWRQNFTFAWVAAFVYFGLAAVLIAQLLDGSVRGYVLALVVGVLALALTDTLAGRRTQSILSAQLTDADRYLVYSRAVEGVVHNLRNHVAVVRSALLEMNSSGLPASQPEAFEAARSAAEDAAGTLRGLTAGTNPRVRYAPKSIQLLRVAMTASTLCQSPARAKSISSKVFGDSSVTVRGDPLLLREVMSNLLLNAIDAAPEGGTVTVTVGMRPDGWAFLSVADNGPGIRDEDRDRLFEPHFTTKAQGTGMGLFTSYGIVREHRGHLLYEGSKKGAIFTVLLPPAGS
jgi:signal transduction histidine kinase